MTVSTALGFVVTSMLVYCMTLASFAPADVTAGVVVGLILWLVFRQFLAETALQRVELPVLSRLRWMPKFLWGSIMEIVRGTWLMLGISLGWRPLTAPGIVEVPIGERSEQGVAMSGLVLTLAPGSALLDVDWDRRVMLVHAVEANDPEAVITDLQQFYESYQRRVFP